MTTVELIQLLDSRGMSPRKSRTGWAAHCCGYDDKEASLSVSRQREAVLHEWRRAHKGNRNL